MQDQLYDATDKGKSAPLPAVFKIHTAHSTTYLRARIATESTSYVEHGSNDDVRHESNYNHSKWTTTCAWGVATAMKFVRDVRVVPHGETQKFLPVPSKILLLRYPKSQQWSAPHYGQRAVALPFHNHCYTTCNTTLIRMIATQTP